MGDDGLAFEYGDRGTLRDVTSRLKGKPPARTEGLFLGYARQVYFLSYFDAS